jgi:hypothetical protein
MSHFPGGALIITGGGGAKPSSDDFAGRGNYCETMFILGRKPG